MTKPEGFFWFLVFFYYYLQKEKQKFQKNVSRTIFKRQQNLSTLGTEIIAPLKNRQSEVLNCNVKKQAK